MIKIATAILLFATFWQLVIQPKDWTFPGVPLLLTADSLSILLPFNADLVDQGYLPLGIVIHLASVLIPKLFLLVFIIMLRMIFTSYVVFLYLLAMALCIIVSYTAWKMPDYKLRVQEAHPQMVGHSFSGWELIPNMKILVGYAFNYLFAIQALHGSVLPNGYTIFVLIGAVLGAWAYSKVADKKKLLALSGIAAALISPCILTLMFTPGNTRLTLIIWLGFHGFFTGSSYFLSQFYIDRYTPAYQRGSAKAVARLFQLFGMWIIKGLLGEFGMVTDGSSFFLGEVTLNFVVIYITYRMLKNEAKLQRLQAALSSEQASSNQPGNQNGNNGIDV
jgi:hypothetical protein